MFNFPELEWRIGFRSQVTADMGSEPPVRDGLIVQTPHGLETLLLA